MVPYSGFGELNMRFDGNGSITMNDHLLRGIYYTSKYSGPAIDNKASYTLKLLRRSLKTPLSNFFNHANSESLNRVTS